MERISRRKPWLAGLLQFTLPGLGNLYSGRPMRALAMFLLFRVSFAAVFIVLLLPGLIGLLTWVCIGLLVTVLTIADAVRCVRLTKAEYNLAPYNRWYIYALIFLAITLADQFIVLPFTRGHVFEAAQVPTASMEPAILPGDHFIVDKTAFLLREPKRGDLATYRPRDFPDTPFVKRIIGLPGETIEIRDRVVFINGVKLDEPYIRFLQPPNPNPAFGDSMPSRVLPSDAYFVLGDTRDNSNDSRYTGPVLRTSLQGVTETIFYSRDPDTGKIRWDRIGMVLR